MEHLVCKQRIVYILRMCIQVLDNQMKRVLLQKSIVFDIFAPFLEIEVPLHSRLNMNKLLTGIFMIISLQMMGQGAVNSPFSRFGIGDLNPEAPMHIRQMGGIGTSLIDPSQLNFDNPATLSHLQTTGFDLGLDFKNSRLSDDRNTSSQWSGNLGYMALGFPLRNPRNAIFTRESYKFNWGMGFAIMPNSSVSYNITRLDSLGTNQLFNRNFEGNGGTYKAVWSNAIKYGDFSLGASIGWLFGNIEYSRNIDFLSEIAAFDNEFRTSYSMRGFYSKFGLIYLNVLNKKEIEDNIGREAPRSLSIGFTYKPGISFNTKSEISNVNLLPVSLTTTLTDTLAFETGVAGSGVLPAELAFGATYTHGLKYAIGFDYRTSFWSNYENDANPEELSNTTRFAIGGYYRPDFTELSILKRASYRFGFYFEEDPRMIESEEIRTFGVTLGVGLPLAWQRRFSNLNLGLDIGKRSVSNILNENFVKITFGFTFNESDWFRKFYLD